MSILKRVKSILTAKTNALLDEMENPEEALKFSIIEMKEQLRKINNSLVEVATIKKKLESDLLDVNGKIKVAQSQAEIAMETGRDDLAKSALEKKHNFIEQEKRIRLEIEDVKSKLDMIRNSKLQLESKINDLENKKKELIAMNKAADAQMTVKETLTGLSNDITDINERIMRAESRIKEKNAKLSAMDELAEIGAISELGNENDVEKELMKIQRERKVKEELEKLKQSKGGEK
ncbi:PspA/IM30 family protein [Wukongibacter baidiensis]|uniref:PspA/IM30 family protein n=1 Tax=Wukongibacter baidiensis TaxID=1723361 RepID=UPI003D7FD9BA